MRDDGEYLSFVDEWGITWAMPKSGGHYFDMVGHPLAKDPLSVEDIEAIELPDMEDGTRYLNVRAQAQKIRDRGYGVVMSSIGAGIHELGGWMRGYENYYADLLLDEELAASYLDRFLEVKMKYWDRVLSEAGDLIDVVQEADDLAARTPCSCLRRPIASSSNRGTRSSSISSTRRAMPRSSSIPVEASSK